MDPKKVASTRARALEDYNYDETYGLKPEEIVSLSVSMGRWRFFQARIYQTLEENGRPLNAIDVPLAAAMLVAASAITHLEEIIRIPAPDVGPAPEVAGCPHCPCAYPANPQTGRCDMCGRAPDEAQKEEKNDGA